MNRTTALALSGILALAVGLPAQTLNATISPNPAPLGVAVNISVTDALGSGAQLPSGCLVTSVTRGGPAGIGIEMISQIACTAIILPIPACGSGNTLAGSWSAAGPNVAPDRYWFNITFWDANFTMMRTESFPFTIEASASDPSLSQTSAAMIGTTLLYQVNSPLDPNAGYICATSATTNTGIPLAGTRTGIDADAIFALSFPNPLPGVFLNYSGVLDGLGNATGIGIALPNEPALSCLSLHTQAVVIPLGGGLPRLTNTVHSVIQ